MEHSDVLEVKVQIRRRNKKINCYCMKTKIVVTCVCCAILASCGNKEKRTAGTPELAVQEVQESSIQLTSTYPASIRGKQDVEIRPQVGGFITKVCVDEGSTVHKGQVLFEIDPTQYEAAFRSAKASVANADAAVNTQEIIVKNKRELNKKEIISDYELAIAENTLASAKAQQASAQAQLVSAKQNLEFTKVKSPSNGIVNTIPYRLGSLVSASVQVPLTVVSDISEMYVYSSLSEKELLELIRTAGGSQKAVVENYPEVQLELSDGSIYEQKGKIETVSGSIDLSTGSATIRATFPNPEQMLRSGGMGNMIIPYNLKDVILISQDATIEIQDKKFVYVLQPDNTVKYTEITISNQEDGRQYLVTSGLKAGDQIVLEGVQTLRDGQKIAPITPEQKKKNYDQALKDQREGNMASAFK